MSKFHSEIRDLLEDVHAFLSNTLQKECLSTSSLAHKEKLSFHLKTLQTEYPQLQLQLMEAEVKADSKRSSISSPLPYLDMNVGSPFKMPYVLSDAEKEENYDVCSPSDAFDSLENHSVTGSEDYPSDEARCLPEVPASSLYSCDKCGFLDKKKRETIKGWLNPFQKRWCAIKNGVLYYYEKTSDRKQKGSIILAGYEARLLPEEGKEGKKYNHCFELVCPGKRTYQFSATSQKDLEQWISAVEKYSNLALLGRQYQKESQEGNKTKVNESSLVTSGVDDIYESVDNDTDNETETWKNSESLQDQTEEKPQRTVENQTFNYSDWYVGLWDCSGSDETELSFYRGDLIHVIDKEYDNFSWWVGESEGKIGFVPKSYLMEAYESC